MISITLALIWSDQIEEILRLISCYLFNLISSEMESLDTGTASTASSVPIPIEL